MRIAVLQAQLQMQSLGKGHLSVGKDETESVPPVSTDTSISPSAQSLQADNFLKAFGKGYSADRIFQPVLPIDQRVRVRGRAFSGLSLHVYEV
jgi:hypothetical protein